ncbi:MAG: hypothetical protein M1820_004218 [Bogoriella megaspora]|nr:MAG: hypothetical protein M1820_004218 [Bogoriella megaspora]
MQRVVDLQEMSIIKTPKNCEYATLSYVWGDASDGRLVLHSENMQVLEKSGSLTKRWDDIPCTICDAITFTQRMGYKYLWVDSLCLVQNDETEMDNAMRRMDLVFRKSSFTIVAATGEGAHHGLPGVGEIPRKCNKSEIEVNCGICLTTIATLDPLLDKTKYATRAWTMQEQLCGTRLLVFINDQIYFQRQKATWSEETTISNRPLAALHREWPRRSLFLTDASSFDDAFRGFLEYYGVREVSKSQDALRAASGVLRRLSEKYRVNFQHGIPLPLHRYLLLLSSGANKRREGHPSYSWTGWTKSLQVYKFEHPAKNMSTWIVWYCLTEKGVFVCDSASRPHQLTIPDNEFLSNAPNFPVVTPIQEVHSAAPLAAMLCKEYDLLVFWTLYINIRLEDYYHVGKQDHGGTRPMGDDGPLRHRVIDTDGNVSGFVMLDNHDVDTQKPQEIALISEAKSRRGRKEYYFLLLDWNGDIAERRGVGSLSRSLKEAFLLQPVGKRIILG